MDSCACVFSEVDISPRHSIGELKTSAFGCYESPSCSLPATFEIAFIFQPLPCPRTTVPTFFLSDSEGRTSKLIPRPLRFASILFFAFIFLGFVQSISAQTVVLYASQAPVKVGNWTAVGDSTAAGSFRLANPDLGAAKVSTAASAPSSYVELSFFANAGQPYHLWIRGKAQDNSPYNDSVFVQFSGSVTSSGSATYRIGTTSALRSISRIVSVVEFKAGVGRTMVGAPLVQTSTSNQPEPKRSEFNLARTVYRSIKSSSRTADICRTLPGR